MKKPLLFLLIFILTFSLFACSLDFQSHKIEDYFVEMEYHDNFKIIQLTDLHFSSYDNLDEDFAFIDLMFKEQKDIDLVVLSGDLFTFSSKNTIKAVFNYFDSKNIPWTFTFGNHDEQVYANYTYPSKYGSSLKNCVYKHIDDDLSGVTNNIINLKENGKTKFQLFIIDSNTYTYIGKNGYNYIQEDQIDWYKKGIEYINKEKFGQDWKVGDETIPSFIFQHIPLPEINDAVKEYNFGDSVNDGEYINEKPCPPLYNSQMFKTLKEYKSTKALFFGHDHINNFKINYEGVDFVYGLKSTDNMYNNENMLGYRLIVIENENTYSTSTISHLYSEVA